MSGAHYFQYSDCFFQLTNRKQFTEANARIQDLSDAGQLGADFGSDRLKNGWWQPRAFNCLSFEGPEKSSCPMAGATHFLQPQGLVRPAPC